MPETSFPELPLFDLQLQPQDLEAVAETLRSGWLTMGPKTAAFEEAFAAHLGARHAITVSSCTAALHFAYLAAGVGPGDEVIVPSYTFAATAAAVVYCGATPVFAEIVSRERPSLDPEDVERRITPRTKAVCVVHFAGYAAAADRLKELCDERGIALIEDVAHAPSATLHGRKLGTWGLAGAFSFFSNKVFSVGEGGLLCTDSDEVAATVRSHRSHTMTSGTWDRHSGLLKELDGVIVPFEDADVPGSSCYVLPIMLEQDGRQAEISRRLREQGIQTSIFYPSIHRFTAYSERFPGVSLPITELASRTELTLPFYPPMSHEDQDRVVASLAEALAS